MYIVYVLKSVNFKKSYVGFTDNVEKRLKEHNNAEISFTSKYKPWTLIYLEQFENRNEAIKREKYLKSASGRRLILKKLFNK